MNNQFSSPAHHLPAGTMLNNKYKILYSLGEGGFGITYKGTDILLDMPVAIKEYFPSGFANRFSSSSLNVTLTEGERASYFSQWKEKFLKEARTIARLNNIDCIVNVRDFFEENGTAYIVMEYLEGRTLKECVEKDGVFEPEEIISLILPMLKSLNKIHNQGLIHRDISPDNIMCMNDGSLKLYDFGAARDFSVQSQHSLSVLLKPGYAPQEQYRSRGNQGPWTDVYAICATIYFCVTGKVPDDSMQRVFEDELKRPSELGINIAAHVENAIMKGLEIREKDRFQSTIELAEELGEKFAKSNNVNIVSSVSDKTSVMPSMETSAPNKTSVMPSTETSAPNKTSDMPSAEASVPNKTSVMPSAEASVPNKTSVMPSAETSVPNKTSVMPSAETSVPNKTSVMPSADTSVPKKTSVMPSAETSVLNKTAVMSDTKNSAPKKTSVMPDSGATVSDKESPQGCTYAYSYVDDKKRTKKSDKAAESREKADRGYWLCLECNHRNYYADNGDNICGRCGKARQVYKKEAQWSCPECGYRNGAGITCASCGHSKPVISDERKTSEANKKIHSSSEKSSAGPTQKSERKQKSPVKTGILYICIVLFILAGPIILRLIISDSESRRSEITATAVTASNTSSSVNLREEFERQREQLEESKETFDKINDSLRGDENAESNIETEELIINDEVLLTFGEAILEYMQGNAEALNGFDERLFGEVTELEINEYSSTNKSTCSIWICCGSVHEYLSIETNKRLIDFDVIARFKTNLKSLSLSSVSGEAVDISAVKNLTKLEKLYLYCPISDISSLKNLKNLKELYLAFNGINDISALENLISLEYLNLWDNEISNISALQNLTSLEYLNLDGNEISDISSLKNLKNLKELYLDFTGINDISALENLTSLEYLDLDGNKISDISPLENLKNLKELSLWHNEISDISALQNLTSLEYLGLGSNEISDISALQNLTSLECLDLSNNKISDVAQLDNLFNLTNLKKLYIVGNDFTIALNAEKITVSEYINEKLPDVWVY